MLPLATAVLLEVYMMMTRIIRNKDDPAATTFYSTALGALILSVVVIFNWQAPTLMQWSLMAAIGWGYLVFADVPSIWTVDGASVVIASGLYVWYRETRVKR